MNAAVEERWLVRWVDTHDRVTEKWPDITEDTAAIVAALLVVADELENISLSVAEK